MLPEYLLPLTANHFRRTDVLQAATGFPFSTSIGDSYDDPLRVKFVGSGLTIDANITILGSLAGAGVTENFVLPYSGSMIKRSANRFDALTSIISTDTIGGTVEVYATTEGGQSFYMDSTVDAALKGRLRQSKRPTLGTTAQGLVIEESWVFYTNATNLLAGDRLTIAGATYRVDGETVVYDGSASHHTEAVLRRI